ALQGHTRAVVGTTCTRPCGGFATAKRGSESGDRRDQHTLASSDEQGGSHGSRMYSRYQQPSSSSSTSAPLQASSSRAPLIRYRNKSPSGGCCASGTTPKMPSVIQSRSRSSECPSGTMTSSPVRGTTVPRSRLPSHSRINTPKEFSSLPYAMLEGSESSITKSSPSSTPTSRDHSRDRKSVV